MSDAAKTIETKAATTIAQVVSNWPAIVTLIRETLTVLLGS